MTRSEAIRFRDHLNSIIETLDDETALDVQDLFPCWVEGKTYAGGENGDRVQYDSVLYRCVQSHTSQASWTPDITPALWTVVSVEEWPEWVQPTGAQDAYRIGAQVSHNSKHWINEMDYNTYEPGVYGWVEAE